MWPFPRPRNKTAPQRSRATTPAVIRARYDAAQTTRENARHWAMADPLSADRAAAPNVRKKLRERSRYEVANNSYARGIVLTIANDCVGTGPRLQLLTNQASINRQVELAFAQWAMAVNLPEKLRTMRMAKSTDGEAFAVLTENPLIDSPVTLDVKLIEADRVASPLSMKLFRNSSTDGINLDAYGNPQSYVILRNHPGDVMWSLQYDLVPAEAVIHWFRCDRPGQHRGVPEITPALPLFAQLRRYTLAVLAAAETAADFAAVLFTDSPANGEAQALEPMDVVDLEKRMATVLPDGWRLGQIEAQQPATAYGEFKHEILNEIARCLNLPYNIAACNSSGYNYASGRLDHQTYYKSIRVEQSHLQTAVLDRIFKAWLSEAALIEGLLPQALRQTDSHVLHSWFWDGVEHVDPAKEANAQATRLSSNTTTLAAEYARQGKDWETELRQRAKERKLMNQLGLTDSQATPTPAPTTQPAQENNANAATQRQAA